jgi:hypothetical protein
MGAVTVALPYTEPRVMDSLPRYYRFPGSFPGAFTINVSSPMSIGQLTASLRTNCADPASQIASGSLPYVLGGRGLTLVSVPAGGVPEGTTDLWLVITGITQGLTYTLQSP